METTVKTLGESYEGMLSRDWEKLLTIIESGERRVFISRQEVESDSGPRNLYHIGIANCYLETDGKIISYNIDAMFGPFDRKWIIEWIDKSIVGWFPTKDDFPAPSVEPAPLEWHHYEDGSALSSFGDWSFYADDEGAWNIKYKTIPIEIGCTRDCCIESPMQVIHEWRINHLNSMIKK